MKAVPLEGRAEIASSLNTCDVAGQTLRLQRRLTRVYSLVQTFVVFMPVSASVLVL